MPSGWQQGISPATGHLKGLLVEDMTPAYLRQSYLLGIDLGAAWDGAPGDAAMQQFLNAAINDVQSKVGVRFSQQKIFTDPDPGKVLGTDYDILGERLHYFPPSSGESVYFIPLPYANVVSIQRVRMFFAGAELTEIPSQWVQFTSKEGVLRVVPSLNPWAVANTGVFLYPIFQARIISQDTPGVWSVDYTVGHGKIDYDLAHYIALTAAIHVLSIAGTGKDVSHGLASESLSMDGISESVSYAQGKYGIYSGVIQAYKDMLDSINLDKKRGEKKGIKLGVA